MSELHAQAKAVFLRAIELEPDRRAAFVAQACAQNEPLRREVESLLAHHDPHTLLGATPADRPDPVLAVTEAHVVGRKSARVAGTIFAQLFGNLRRKYAAVLVSCAFLLALGVLVYTQIHQATKTKLEQELTTLLAADVEALRIWLGSQQAIAAAIASTPDVRRLAQALVDLDAAGEFASQSRLASNELRELRERMQPLLDAHGYEGFLLVDPQGRIVAAGEDALIGDLRLAADQDALRSVFGLAAKPDVVLPRASHIPLLDSDGQYRVGVPTMFAIVPVRDDGSSVVAALGLRIQPERDFTRILSVARAGQTGDTYAFDQTGRLLSESRFDDQLRDIGLIPDQPHVRSILNVELRDPGVDMTRGRRPVLRRAEQPLTRMAAAAVVGQSGVAVDGYRDYRGVPVVGAWTWLPDYELGVATEIAAQEAFAVLQYLDLIFGGLFVVIAAAVGATLWSSFFAARLHREVHQARQVGQYTLEKLIGEGGMGQVYLARHALLKRPTAVKLLRPEQTSPLTIARFEREVQLASQLTHPNTIEIYDFGRTPEGLFYYAMEYLPGLTLHELVRQAGPLPPERVIYILRQVCGSLQEAHGIGLIHRDIKPQNIMLCERGGQWDVVKVLDFGLVKQMAEAQTPQLTADFQVSGTPLYIAPEVWSKPQEADARADIYALGVVAFNLLTANDPFEAGSVGELCRLVTRFDPPPPSSRTNTPIPPQLDQLVLSCLARDPRHRPATVGDVLVVLDGELGLPRWTAADARQWWAQRQSLRSAGSVPTDSAGERRASAR